MSHASATATTVATPALRPPSARDRDAIEAISRAVALFRGDEIPVALEVFDAAVAGDPSYEAVIATLDDVVAGWICWGATPCTLGTYDLYWMAVDPSRHGAGIGTALLREMEHRLAS
nr:GNAT family N-acetyltransferase [Gemmatimonadales bacterium]